MNKRVLMVLIFGIVLSGFLIGEVKSEVPLIPVEDFFRNPEATDFKLSPDGTCFSFLKPWKNRLNIHIQKIGSKDFKRVTSSEKRDIQSYEWVNNQRLIYIQDKGGDENYKVYGANIDGSNSKELTPFNKVQVQLIDNLENDSNHILISMNKRNKQVFDVYRLNVNSGKIKLVAKNPGNISAWKTDHSGKVRIAMTTDGVNSSLLYREKETEPFKEVIKTTFKDTVEPLSFTSDNKFLYISSNLKSDKSAIYKYDIKNNRFMEKVFEHPDVDVDGLLYSSKKKKVLGVTYYTDKKQYKFFDKEREELQKRLEKKLPGVVVDITGFSKDENRVIVRTFSDKTRGAYYFYDISKRTLKKIAEVSPWIKPEQMATMKPIKYKSRDGLTIHGYLTLPVGVKARNLKIVVNPHGGPWSRDRWRYNCEVQLFANRGYGVLQMNFRGSMGYGRKFWEAGFKKWGKEMQKDITDGVKWLISEGIGDPQNIAIYGGSYGGYAALAGVTFTPDLYKCAIDYVGVSNILSWMKAIPPYWKPYLQMIYEMVGDPVKDEKMLKEVSPFFHVDKIKVPIFVAQGANDPRVSRLESDQIVAKLRKRGIPVEYMVKENEGHGFQNQENSFDFYKTMVKFLKTHLGGR